MPSLLKQLFETFPLSGAAGKIFHIHGADIDAAEVNDAANYLTFFEGGATTSIQVDCSKPSDEVLGYYQSGDDQPTETWERDADVHTEILKRGTKPVRPHDLQWTKAEKVPIWSYRTAKEPNRFIDIACRSREANYSKFLTLTQAAWGLEGPNGLEPAIKVNLLGAEVTLPLTAETRLLTFRVRAGYHLDSFHPLWPLRARHDDSIVHVFAFDIQPVLLRKMALTDPSHPEADKVAAMLALCRRAFSLSKEECSGMSMGQDVFVDDLWPDAIEAKLNALSIGDYANLLAKPVRVLVATSITGCRENWEYTPGAATGMARLYPSLFVKSHAPLNRVEAVLHLDRPSTTTVLEGPGCHDQHGAPDPEMKTEIGSILCTDANEGMEVMSGIVPLDYTQPYWSNLFSYYLTEVYDKVGGALLNMVRNDRPKARAKLDLLRRHPVITKASNRIEPTVAAGEAEDGRARLVIKRPRQGAFDNVHLAPRMKLPFDKGLVEEIGSLNLVVPLAGRVADAEKWRMDDVVMAPFCAHDCFHLHWRWSDSASDRWACGWGPLGPYTVPGACMIPSDQTLDLRMRSDHQVSYIAKAFDVPADKPVTFCHHGAAYAVMVGKQVALARTSVLVGHSPSLQFRDGSRAYHAANSWAAFYWQLRYDLRVRNFVYEPRERLDIYDLQKLLDM